MTRRQEEDPSPSLFRGCYGTNISLSMKAAISVRKSRLVSTKHDLSVKTVGYNHEPRRRDVVLIYYHITGKNHLF